MKVDSFSWKSSMFKIKSQESIPQIQIPHPTPPQCSNFPQLGMDDNQMPMDRQGRGGGKEGMRGTGEGYWLRLQNQI